MTHPHRSGPRTFISAFSLLALAAGLTGGMPARGQTAESSAPTAPPAPTTPSVTELKARAYDAQQAEAEAARKAQEAQQAADAARQQAVEAQRALQTASPAPAPVAPTPAPVAPVAPVPVAVPTPAPAPAPAPVAAGAVPDATSTPVPPVPAPAAQKESEDPELAQLREQLERTQEEAKNAASAARAATRALEEHVAQEENRFARKGVVLAGGFLWAPDLFDTILTVDSSTGAWGALGYRFTPRIEADVRFDWIDGWTISGYDTTGSVDGWTVIADMRLFLLTKSIQPFLGFGLGAMQAHTKLREIGGPGYIDRTDTAMVFRASAGIDYYISESFALTADAGINLPGGDLSGLTYGTISGGAKLRF